jgi:hypothetical protein
LAEIHQLAAFRAKRPIRIIRAVFGLRTTGGAGDQARLG